MALSSFSPALQSEMVVSLSRHPSIRSRHDIESSASSRPADSRKRDDRLPYASFRFDGDPDRFPVHQFRGVHQAFRNYGAFVAGGPRLEQSFSICDPRNRIGSGYALNSRRSWNLDLRSELLAESPFRPSGSRQDTSHRHTGIRFANPRGTDCSIEFFSERARHGKKELAYN